MKKIVLSAFLMSAVSAYSQKLEKFTSELGKKTIMGKEIRLPYTELISYYGYIKPGTKPDQVRNGKNFYYMYLWVPVAAPEIGVRMASPIPSRMEPTKDDKVSVNFSEGAADKDSYFDTWVSLERADNILLKSDLKNAKSANWKTYGQNDDSDEMPSQPSGNKRNSLLRVTSEINNPSKALVAGLYRICFTTYKSGDVKGSFVAQVGAPVKLPGVIIAQTVEEIEKS